MPGADTTKYHMTLEIRGLNEAQYALDRLAGCLNATEMAPVLEDIGRVAKRATRRAFEQERAPEILPVFASGSSTAAAGKKWAPFAPGTKRKYGDMASAKLLQDRGIMAGSLSSRILRAQLFVGVGVFYGIFHQLGTKFIPARPFLGFDEADNQTIVDLILAHIRAARSAGK